MPLFLGHSRDRGGELQGQHHEWLAPIGAHDQKVGAGEPLVKLAKSIAATLDLDAAIDAEQRHGNVATEAAARGATQRHALGGEACVLKRANKRALEAIALLARGATAAHGSLRTRR